MKFEESDLCPPLRLLRVERVSVQHRRRPVGRLRARHGSRCGVRQALAAVQRRNAAPLARPEHHHRVHPPGHQRNRSGSRGRPRRLGLPYISAAPRGPPRRRAFGRLPIYRSAARCRPRPTGARRRQPIVSARLLALRPPSEYPHPAGLSDLDRLVGDPPCSFPNRRTPCVGWPPSVWPS